MGTLENMASGVVGSVLLLVGFIAFFFNWFIGSIIMIIGFYLKYKSETYVHN